MYGEVLWIEHAQGMEARDAFLGRLSRASVNMAGDDATPVLVGNPGAASLFSGTVYVRGALTLHALREEIGDDAFFAVLQAWTARYANGNGATGDFIATAEEVSGRDLHAFFDAWLYSADVPGQVTDDDA
jgi:aminopeptidase N